MPNISNKIFRKYLGETIYEAYKNAFSALFDGGRQQACYENALSMKAKGYPIEDIVEITGLSDEIVDML